MNIAISSSLADAMTYTDYSALSTANIQMYTYNSTSLEVDFQKVKIDSNQFQNNMFGFGKGLMTIIGL